MQDVKALPADGEVKASAPARLEIKSSGDFTGRACARSADEAGTKVADHPVTFARLQTMASASVLMEKS